MRARISILIILLFVFLQTTGVAAKDAPKISSFSEIVLSSSKTDLLLFATLDNTFTPEMITGIHSGVPIEFVFFIELDEFNKEKIGEKILSTTLTYTLTYDTLKNHYNFDLYPPDSPTSKYTTLQDASRRMHNLLGVPLIKLNKLTSKNSYQLSIKAKLQKKTLPLKLHYIIPFVSWWDLKTNWSTTKFRIQE